MARKKKDDSGSDLWQKAKWVGFVNIRLSNEEKKEIKKNLLDEEQGLQFLTDAATAGYKCSLSYSIPEDVYTVSMTGQYQNKPNAGATMSMRHVDLVTCLTALKWCHESAGVGNEWTERFTLVGDDSW